MWRISNLFISVPADSPSLNDDRPSAGAMLIMKLVKWFLENPSAVKSFHAGAIYVNDLVKIGTKHRNFIK